MAEPSATEPADDATTYATKGEGAGPASPDEHAAASGGFDWPRWFVLVGAVLGLVYVATMPVGRPLDEPAHLRRVDTLLHGVVIPPGFHATAAGYRVDGCLDALLDRSASHFQALIDGTAPHESRGARWRPAVRNPPCRPDTVLQGGGTISGTEVNSPIPYVPAMVGFAVGRSIGGALGAVYGARLVQLAVYLAICWWALRRLPWGRPFAAAVALVPTALGGAAGVSADPVTLALALAAVSATLAIVAGTERRPVARPSAGGLVGLSAVFVALGLCKPAVAPLVALAVVVPTAAFVTVRRRLVWVAATVGAVALTGGLWAVTVTSRVHITTTPHVDSAVTGAWLNQHPWTLPATLWRTLSISDASRYLLGGVVTPLGLDVLVIPVWLTFAGVAVLVVARLVDPPWMRLVSSRPASTERPGRLRTRPGQKTLERMVAVGIGVIGILAVTYGIYLASNPPRSSVISGIQGRYFLPYTLLVLLGIRPRGIVRVSRRAPQGLMAALVVMNVLWIIRVLGWWHLV